MVDKKKMTGMLIHSFAVAHAVTAALLAQTMVGDEAALTALTVAMIMAVAKMNGADWDSGTALAFLGVFIGSYVGVRGATFLIKWVPGIGNAANAGVTLVTTEVLGWATYAFVQKSKNKKDVKSKLKKMTKEEKDGLWSEAKSLRKEEKEEGKKLYESMSKEDKKEYEEIMTKLRAKDLSDEERIKLIEKLEAITERITKDH